MRFVEPPRHLAVLFAERQSVICIHCLLQAALKEHVRQWGRGGALVIDGHQPLHHHGLAAELPRAVRVLAARPCAAPPPQLSGYTLVLPEHKGSTCAYDTHISVRI